MSNTLPEALQRLENSFKQRSTDMPPAIIAKSRSRKKTNKAVDSLAVSTSLPLFDLDKRNQRLYLKDALLHVPGVGKVNYRGQELRNDDWAVWSQLIDRVQKQPQQDWVAFSPRSLLKALGWGIGKYDHERLRACLERMQATVLRLPGKYPDSLLSMSLISQCQWLPSPKGHSGCWRIKIESEIRVLFITHQMH